MASYHDRAAEGARKRLLTLLEAEKKPLIMDLIRKVRDLGSVQFNWTLPK